MHYKLVSKLFFLLIIILGIYLRFANLENNPGGFYVDEASTGYNAYSILLTGKDEYGKNFPLAFRFFGSYTPPVYTYLTSIVINFLGLTVFSTRFISALAGSLSIIVFYFFIKEFITTKFGLPLIGAFLMTVNPWSLFYSRIGYEVNLAFLFFILGIYFLWKGLEKSKLFILGFGFLSLSSLTYHAERLLAPVILIAFLFVFSKDIFKKANKKILVISSVIYFVFLIPQLLIFFTPANTSRGMGIFYTEAIINQSSHLKLLGPLSVPASFLRDFSAQYFSYYSPNNLFFEGDSDMQRSLPELSVFYPWMFIFFLVGLFSFTKQGLTKTTKFILILLILSPVPASLAKDPFSTQRALPLLLPILIIITLGIKVMISRYPKIGIFLIIIFIPVTFLQIYRSLAVLLPNERALVWGMGFSQLAEEIKKRPADQFLIDDTRLKPVYIELAFFLKFPPKQFQETIDPKYKNHYYTDTMWNSYYKFGKVEIRGINWQEDSYKNQILVGDELFISPQQANEHFLHKEFEIKNSTGTVIFQGFRTNPSLKNEIK
jgi:4-amino-4-deoxy-L-arabinose transferase-like glycosyltransferase